MFVLPHCLLRYKTNAAGAWDDTTGFVVGAVREPPVPL